MYRTSVDFHKRLMRGEIPTGYIVILTHMGLRVYGEKKLKITFSPVDAIEQEGRVISFGSFERALQAITSDILASYQSRTLQHMSVQLDNSDDKFSKLIATEPFISRTMKYYVGFEDLSQSEHLVVFSGIITEMQVLNVLTIDADEN